ncbi:MAG TPA: YebC/PmpR family DNA-binding transcriptional regulator [Acidobacteriota bacterium]|nr:YebC/PmpR family DNA-binding transcriptional regulator [Acidobacteriota bacterium]
MSGHSKWHSIKHKKAAADAKRGKIFTKLIKEMSVAARIGGGDIDSNPRLRTAVAAAKAVNMPLDNIKRAIMKGTGELPGQAYEAVTYEGYGPGGVAVLVETLTDNKNRTVAEVRHLFSKHGGNLAETGAVQWMFERKGYISVSRDKVSEDRLMEIALEAGADDLQTEESAYSIYTSFENFESVKEALQAAGIEPDSAELTMLPQNGVRLEGKKAEQMLKLMESLEDHDDVQNVYANFDIDEAEMEAIANG